MLHKEISPLLFWIVENTWIPVCVQKVEFLIAFAEFLKTIIGFVICLSACPSLHMEQLRLHTEWIFLKFVIWIFCENLSRTNLMKIWQEWRVTDMNSDVYFWSCLAQFLLEWKMFETNIVEKTKTHISCSKRFFFRKSCRLWENLEKYSRAEQASNDIISHAQWMLDT
jgi:hypothetical protein